MQTVQVITFLSLLYKKEGARPFLVVVPNSTLGNWAREFERWAPAMRVVAYGVSPFITSREPRSDLS